MKKWLVVLGIILVAVWVPLKVSAEEISRFENTISIQSDGTIRVREVIHYDFGPISRHGIFRTVPKLKTSEIGKKFLLQMTDFSVANPQNHPIPYAKSQGDGVITMKIGDPDKTVEGIQEYAISYTVGGAITYFSDHDELYWNITGDRWEIPITEAMATVKLPQQIAKEHVQLVCFSGFSGSRDSHCAISYNEKTQSVYVSTQSPLAPSEGLTVVVGFPKGIVEVLEPKEYVSFWETLLGKAVFGILIIVAVFWYIVSPLVLPILWWKYGRDPKPPIGEATAWFEAPSGKSGRKLTPAETGTLLDERADNADVTATIIDLARRGYIQIIEKAKGDISLKKMHASEKTDGFEPFEKRLMDGIFDEKETVRLKTADLSSTINEVKNKLYDSVLEEEFFPRNPRTVRTAFSIGSVAALVTGNFLLFLSLLFFGYHMPRKTIRGAAAAAVARALKSYIVSQSRQFSFQAQKQIIFEKMLPFAIAFGVENIWIARFAHMHVSQPSWYQGYSGSRFNVIAFNDSLHATSSGLSRASTSTTSSGGFSSGFSGGSSGGGGGGGGGGSW